MKRPPPPCPEMESNSRPYGFWEWARDSSDLIVTVSFLLFLLGVFALVVLGTA